MQREWGSEEERVVCVSGAGDEEDVLWGRGLVAGRWGKGWRRERGGGGGKVGGGEGDGFGDVQEFRGSRGGAGVEDVEALGVREEER